ncbi:MAG: ABC-F family ATP-binding cassette domain-containing protein [Alphaproteobacteria bacterium]|nr:ABC-F family ATP-binding cassette domain-containing protein [Alphaproteobacteria bacterium]MDD9919147.1 ABC-F family ATP-binding cassette domain-containing protein [Alphaproteobacteria bacterium]
MFQVKLQNIGFGYTDTLFEGLNLVVTEKDRIGIVGHNGEGKSTLLKCLAGKVSDMSGQIIKPKGARLSFVEQGVPADISNLSLYDFIASGISEEERDYCLWKVDVALDAFGAKNALRNRPICKLSGGWQRLALIARAMVSEPDMLLLDEPTNHLDTEKITVLERWLNEQASQIPLVIVSHDRRFLDICTNKTWFLRGKTVQEYAKPFTQAKKLLQEDDSAAASQRDKELTELRRLEKSAHELRQRGVNNYSDTSLQKAKQMDRKVERLASQVTQVHTEKERDITLDNSFTHAKNLLSLSEVDVLAPDKKHLFYIDKLNISQGDRVVVIGENGCGKSQFIKLLKMAFENRGQLDSISITPTAKLGYVDQKLSGLLLNRTVLDCLQELAGVTQQRAVSLLTEAGFPYGMQKVKVEKLSYGQRARLNLLVLRLLEPNFYIMDEPTNHLDIAGQEALESEILKSNASGILVSHDRFFVQNLGTRFFEVNGGLLQEIDKPDVFFAA